MLIDRSDCHSYISAREKVLNDQGLQIDELDSTVKKLESENSNLKKEMGKIHKLRVETEESNSILQGLYNELLDDWRKKEAEITQLKDELIRQ